MHKRLGVLTAAVLATLLGGRAAWGAMCYWTSDEKNPGKGVATHWPTAQPIKVWIYYPKTGGKMPADRAKVTDEVMAAFKAYELKCTNLKFKLEGVQTTLITQVKGAIVVYFGTNAESPSTWPGGSSIYQYNMKWKDVASGEIEEAQIGLNASPTSAYEWVIGSPDGKKNQIDIRSAMIQMIPGAVGYFVGADQKTGQVNIQVGVEQRTLTQEQTDGATYIYFDKAQAGCTQPAQPKACDPNGPAIGDSGVPVKNDGGVGGDGNVPPVGDGGTVRDSGGGTGDSGLPIGVDGSVGGDGGTTGGSGGCCRVSYVETSDAPYAILVGLALVGLLVSRRRRRR